MIKKNRIYSFYNFFLFIWLKRTIAFFLFIYTGYLVQEFIVLNYYKDINDLDFDFLNLAKFFYLDFLSAFAIIFAISISTAFLWSFYFVSKNHFLFLLELSGESSFKTTVILSSFLLLVSLVLFAVHENISKLIARQNTILYEDEIIKNPYLKSNLNFYPRDFIRVKDQTYLFFSELTLDAIGQENSKIYSILIWNKSYTEYDIVLLAKDALITNDRIQLIDYSEYTFYKNDTSKKFTSLRKKDLTLPWSMQTLSSGYEAVNLRNLHISELYNLVQINQSLNLDTNKYLIFLVEPFLVFIFLPLLIVILVFESLLKKMSPRHATF